MPQFNLTIPANVDNLQSDSPSEEEIDAWAQQGNIPTE